MERLKHIIEINILLGAWLIASPFVFGYATSRLEIGNDVLVGIVLIASAWWMLAAAAGRIGAGILQLVCGVWLVVAPFVFHYARSSTPFNNDITVGIASVLVSAVALRMLESRVNGPGNSVLLR